MNLENIKNKHYLLNPIAKHSTQADFPSIVTQVQLQKNVDNAQILLTLSYQILAKSTVKLVEFDQSLVKPTDFLWENDCLECFIQLDERRYFEINASPSGAFALYEFDDYRTPNQLPPRATDKLTFIWQNPNCENYKKYNNCNSHFEFSVILPTNFLPTKINPTAILYQTINGKKQPIFYAVNHASLPDFHNKNFWQNC